MCKYVKEYKLQECGTPKSNIIYHNGLLMVLPRTCDYQSKIPSHIKNDEIKELKRHCKLVK